MVTTRPSQAKGYDMDCTHEYIEVDTPWFDEVWVLDHPEFPLAVAS